MESLVLILGTRSVMRVYMTARIRLSRTHHASAGAGSGMGQPGSLTNIRKVTTTVALRLHWRLLGNLAAFLNILLTPTPGSILASAPHQWKAVGAGPIGP